MPVKVTEFVASPRLGTTGLNSRRRGLEAILRAGKATDGGRLGPHMRVLLIEDDSATAQSIELMLKSENFNVYTTDLGEEGVDLGKLYDYDIIMLDLHLPDMHGDEVLRQLRADRRTKDIPVAIVSADATPGQIERLLAAGAQSYLTKPLDIKNLLAFVDETSAQVKASRTDREHPNSLQGGHFESTVEYSPRSTS